jgi:hypothetical protein
MLMRHLESAVPKLIKGAVGARVPGFWFWSSDFVFAVNSDTSKQGL